MISLNFTIEVNKPGDLCVQYKASGQGNDYEAIVCEAIVARVQALMDEARAVDKPSQPKDAEGMEWPGRN